MSVTTPLKFGDFDDYREFLKEILRQRTSINPKYSLRGFARDLEMTPPRLSEVLNGKRNISAKTAAKIALSLDLNEEEREWFCTLVQVTDAPSQDAKDIARISMKRFKTSQGKEYEVVEDEIFHVIADWYHFGILELTHVTGFRSSPEWISKKLGISPEQAKDAIQRLMKLEMLRLEEGRMVSTNINISTKAIGISEARRRMFRQLLHCARDALLTNKVEERDFSTMIMAIDPTRIAAAEEKIFNFTRELTDFLEQGERKELYCFSSQLFRLSALGDPK